MLRKYNGAILADAVGLGKTFSALAVIKYFQTQNYLTVLLCPKKLEQNWTQYLRRTGSRFEKDEFDYIVRFHTDMQGDRLDHYNDAKLNYLQTRKKILIVIDESHNLRNEKSGRYQELMSKLIQNKEGQENRDVKVLMLSATPINTGLNDVKGQFNLIGHGNDAAFDNEEFGVESLLNLFKDAQSKYTQWCNNPDRTIGGFIATLPPKFFNLTDKLIVARTRKLIEKTLGEDLGFPDKDKPVNIYQGVEHLGKLQTTEEIYQKFDELHLTAYQPSLFLEKTQAKARKGLLFHQLAIATLLDFGIAKPSRLVDFIFRVTSLEEEDLTIALEGKDVGTDAVEEPTVVADDHGTAGESLQAFFQGTKGVDVDIIGRLI